MPLTVEEREHYTRGERADVAPSAEEERTAMSLAREFARELSALVTAEVALARTEVAEKMAQAERGVASFSVGLAVLVMGVLVLHAAAILALALVWPGWLAALVIGGGTALVGLILVALGGTVVRTKKLKPTRTLESLKRDQEFVREQRRQAMEA